MTRKEFIKAFALASGTLILPSKAFTAERENYNWGINIFSKHLQWLDYENMAALAAEIGFTGIDLTVRPNGHVLPQNVITDLPKAVKAIEKSGLKVEMITTAITDITEEHTENILKTASGLGVSYYRMGWLKYNEKLTIDENLKLFTRKLNELAELDKKLNIQGSYQNHTGTGFGAPVWDLYSVIKKIDPVWMGCQYDIRHATVENGTSWPLGLEALKGWINTLDIKDFEWQKTVNGWEPVSVPLGEGMVDFNRYIQLLYKWRIFAPISLHFEYKLGGAEHGAKKLDFHQDIVINAMKKDLQTLKTLLKENS